ncbi:MAG: hypothetical protein JWQ21_3641 [Herminiimonas sp.]|nr:hypothetical protein [Herminiimonas sp.]
MKKTLVNTIIAVPLLTLSSMVFASETAPDFDSGGPMLLSAAQMDDVTAGKKPASFSPFGSHSSQIGVSQINISPVIVIQIAMFNTGGAITQIATVISGNFSTIHR